MNINKIIFSMVICIFSLLSNELFAINKKIQLDNGFLVKYECMSIDEDGEFLGDDESIQNFQLTLFSTTKEKIGYLDFEINQRDKTSEILLLGILKEHYKRQGHATRLINLVIEILKSNNIDHVILEVESKNTPARNLYNKLEFIPTENHKNDATSNQDRRIKLIKVF